MHRKRLSAHLRRTPGGDCVNAPREPCASGPFCDGAVLGSARVALGSDRCVRR